MTANPPKVKGGHRDLHKEFITTFNKLEYKHDRWSVFSDFVMMSAASVHNRFAFCQNLEDQYMKIQSQYNSEELNVFAELLAILVMGLQNSGDDFLGKIMMDLDFGNKYAGQFFTPPSVSDLIAQMVSPDYEEVLKEKPFITLSEPSCGGGVMVLSYVKNMRRLGVDPTEKIFVHCMDVDRRCAYMTFIQLALLGIPAEVVCGNTLTLDVYFVLRTPMYYIGNWENKLKKYEEQEGHNPLSKPVIQTPQMTPGLEVQMAFAI